MQSVIVPRAQVGLIGGSADERMIYATKLRQRQISCFTEFTDRKRDKMYKRAAAEAVNVVDLDDPEEREWLDGEIPQGDASLDKPYAVASV